MKTIGYNPMTGECLWSNVNVSEAVTGTGSMDIEASGGNFRMQFMFIIAFIVNAVVVFWIGRRWQAKEISLWGIFLIFWFIDASVPWLYQTLVFGSSFIPTVLILAFLPALIIALSIRMNYRKLAIPERR